MANIWLNFMLASGKAFSHTAERTVVKFLDKSVELQKDLAARYDKVTSVTGSEENMLQVLHNRVEDFGNNGEDNSNVDLNISQQSSLLLQQHQVQQDRIISSDQDLTILKDIQKEQAIVAQSKEMLAPKQYAYNPGKAAKLQHITKVIKQKRKPVKEYKIETGHISNAKVKCQSRYLQEKSKDLDTQPVKDHDTFSQRSQWFRKNDRCTNQQGENMWNVHLIKNPKEIIDKNRHCSNSVENNFYTKDIKRVIQTINNDVYDQTVRNHGATTQLNRNAPKEKTDFDNQINSNPEHDQPLKKSLSSNQSKLVAARKDESKLKGKFIHNTLNDQNPGAQLKIKPITSHPYDQQLDCKNNPKLKDDISNVLNGEISQVTEETGKSKSTTSKQLLDTFQQTDKNIKHEIKNEMLKSQSELGVKKDHTTVNIPTIQSEKEISSLTSNILESTVDSKNDKELEYKSHGTSASLTNHTVLNHHDGLENMKPLTCEPFEHNAEPPNHTAPSQREEPQRKTVNVESLNSQGTVSKLNQQNSEIAEGKSDTYNNIPNNDKVQLGDLLQEWLDENLEEMLESKATDSLERNEFVGRINIKLKYPYEHSKASSCMDCEKTRPEDAIQQSLDESFDRIAKIKAVGTPLDTFKKDNSRSRLNEELKKNYSIDRKDHKLNSDERQFENLLHQGIDKNVEQNSNNRAAEIATDFIGRLNIKLKYPYTDENEDCKDNEHVKSATTSSLLNDDKIQFRSLFQQFNKTRGNETIEPPIDLLEKNKAIGQLKIILKYPHSLENKDLQQNLHSRKVNSEACNIPKKIQFDDNPQQWYKDHSHKTSKNKVMPYAIQKKNLHQRLNTKEINNIKDENYNHPEKSMGQLNVKEKNEILKDNTQCTESNCLQSKTYNSPKKPNFEEILRQWIDERFEEAQSKFTTEMAAESICNQFLAQLNVKLSKYTNNMENDGLEKPIKVQEEFNYNNYFEPKDSDNLHGYSWFKDIRHMSDLLRVNNRAFNEIEKQVTRALLARKSWRSKSISSMSGRGSKHFIEPSYKPADISTTKYFSQCTPENHTSKINAPQNRTVKEASFSTMSHEQSQPKHTPSLKATDLNLTGSSVRSVQQRQLQSSKIYQSSNKSKNTREDMQSVDQEDSKQRLNGMEEPMSEKFKYLQNHKAVLQYRLPKDVQQNAKFDNSVRIDPNDVKERSDILQINQKVFAGLEREIKTIKIIDKGQKSTHEQNSRRKNTLKDKQATPSTTYASCTEDKAGTKASDNSVALSSHKISSIVGSKNNNTLEKTEETEPKPSPKNIHFNTGNKFERKSLSKKIGVAYKDFTKTETEEEEQIHTCIESASSPSTKIVKYTKIDRDSLDVPKELITLPKHNMLACVKVAKVDQQTPQHRMSYIEERLRKKIKEIQSNGDNIIKQKAPSKPVRNVKEGQTEAFYRSKALSRKSKIKQPAENPNSLNSIVVISTSQNKLLIRNASKFDKIEHQSLISRFESELSLLKIDIANIKERQSKVLAQSNAQDHISAKKMTRQTSSNSIVVMPTSENKLQISNVNNSNEIKHQSSSKSELAQLKRDIANMKETQSRTSQDHLNAEAMKWRASSNSIVVMSTPENKLQIRNVENSGELKYRSMINNFQSEIAQLKLDIANIKETEIKVLDRWYHLYNDKLKRQTENHTLLNNIVVSLTPNNKLLIRNVRKAVEMKHQPISSCKTGIATNGRQIKSGHGKRVTTTDQSKRQMTTNNVDNIADSDMKTLDTKMEYIENKWEKAHEKLAQTPSKNTTTKTKQHLSQNKILAKHVEDGSQSDFDALSSLIMEEHHKIFGRAGNQQELETTDLDERQPAGNHLHNQLPLYFKEKLSSVPIVPGGTIWNIYPKIPFCCKYVTKQVKSKSNAKKYKYETTEIKSTSGDKIKITLMVPDE